MRLPIILVTLTLLTIPIDLLACQEIRIAFSTDSKPYVDTAHASGFEVDLASAVLKNNSTCLKPYFLPNKRALEALLLGKVDAMAPVPTNTQTVDMYLSKSYASYINAVVYHKSNNARPLKIDDLSHHKVLAFHDAHFFLGKDFADKVKNFNDYEETVDQKSQVFRFHERKDVSIILDINIFRHYSSTYFPEKDPTSIGYAFLFSPSDRSFAFLDKKLKESFDAGLAQCITDGTYLKISQKYNIAIESLARNK